MNWFQQHADIYRLAAAISDAMERCGYTIDNVQSRIQTDGLVRVFIRGGNRTVEGYIDVRENSAAVSLTFAVNAALVDVVEAVVEATMWEREQEQQHQEARVQ